MFWLIRLARLRGSSGWSPIVIIVTIFAVPFEKQGSTAAP